jgi:nucleotide-binding universal stress UspA family protein
MTLKPRILVAVDESDYAPMVAEEASKISAQKGADVSILSVVPVQALASEGEIDDQFITDEEKELNILHANLISRYFTGHGTLVESKVLYGDPADRICEYAEAIGADTIVVGSAGKGKIEAFLLGSVSEKVAKRSKRSVMIVRKPKRD